MVTWVWQRRCAHLIPIPRAADSTLAQLAFISSTLFPAESDVIRGLVALSSTETAAGAREGDRTVLPILWETPLPTPTCEVSAMAQVDVPRPAQRRQPQPQQRHVGHTQECAWRVGRCSVTAGKR